MTAVLPVTVSAVVTDVICIPGTAREDLGQWFYEPHAAWDGKDILLKAVIYTDDTSEIEYTWNLGDGSPTEHGFLSGATRYFMETTHTYSGPVGTPFTANLSTWDGVDSMNDVYKVRMWDVSDRVSLINAQANNAIDDGLWYIYKTQQPSGAWVDGYSSYYASVTSSCVLAFALNGHTAEGDPTEDPYVPAVIAGLDYVVNSRLQAYGIGEEPCSEGGNFNPDQNGNGIGVDLVEGTDPYTLGMVMDAIVAATMPADDCGRDFDGAGGNDTYFDVVQDMCDMYSYGQRDYPYPGYGGWRYEWEYGDSDNSACQWAAIGMISAERNWGCAIDPCVKAMIDDWLAYSYNATYQMFGYSYSGNWGNYSSIATRPSGMVQLAFIGLDVGDYRWDGCMSWYDVASNWAWFINHRAYYGWYSFVKAMRLTGTELFPGGYNWYYSDGGGTYGIAERLINDQSQSGGARGQWPSGSQVTHPGYYGYDMVTAWSIVMLRPSPTELGPVAIADAAPNPTDQDVPVTFDASGSYHLDSPDHNIVLIEWDFDDDGTYDWSSGDVNETVEHAFHCDQYPDPCEFPVTLKVTDDQDLFSIDVVVVQVTVPPHPPNAVPGGPYCGCPDEPVLLDASGSFDINVGDHIVSWGWELDLEFPYDFDDAMGEQVERSWAAPGVYDIGLVVEDFLGGLRDTAWTTVTIIPSCLATGEAMFIPDEWNEGWTENPERGWVRCFIGNMEAGFSVEDIDWETILLNDTVGPFPMHRIIDTWPGFEGKVLEVRFDRAASVEALGEMNGNSMYDVLLTGSVRASCGGIFLFEALTEVSLPEGRDAPSEFELGAGVPNPFNPATRIAYGLPHSAVVELAIYNTLGQRVRLLVSGQESAGYKTVVWDGRGDDGRPLPSGTYYYMLKAGEFTESKKLLLLK